MVNDDALARLRVRAAMNVFDRDEPSPPPWVTGNDFWGEPAAILRCPVCASEYQHHQEVEVFSRPQGEDGISVVH